MKEVCLMVFFEFFLFAHCFDYTVDEYFLEVPRGIEPLYRVLQTLA